MHPRAHETRLCLSEHDAIERETPLREPDASGSNAGRDV